MPPGAILVREVATRLLSTLADVSWVKVTRVEVVGGDDLAVTAQSADGCRVEFLVHVKSELRPVAFSTWATARRHTDAVHVLALPVVSPRLAELCRHHGWSWLDLVGNCWLDVPGVLRIERTGAAPAHKLPRRGHGLKTPAAARVLRVLLSPAHAGRAWTQRTIQAATCDHLPGAKQVSLGLVNKVVQHLRDQAFVEDGEAGLRLRDPVGLLSAWRDQYRLDPRQRLSFFTLSKPKVLSEAIDGLTSEFGTVCVYAAYSAAERQAPQVRQPRTWVYVRADHLDDFVRATGATPVDSGENLVVLLPGDPGVFQNFGALRSGGHTDHACTDPVQTHVDLTELGGRGLEAAQAILEQRLLPAWQKVGLA